MKEQMKKLEAHVETLLDLLLDANAKWAVLHPALVNRALITIIGAGRRARGLDVVRRSIMQSCVQDIAQIAFEPDKRSPSISKVMDDIETPSTLRLLRKKYLDIWVGSPTDPGFDAKRLAEATIKFDSALAEARTHWKALVSSRELKAFKKFRDKQLAHVELMYSKGKYHRLDVSKLGIKWKDIGLTLSRLEPIIMALNTVVRCAWIDLVDAREQFEENAQIFWSQSGLPNNSFNMDVQNQRSALVPHAR